jgi:Protein of unknown function (DUF3501)
VSRQLTLDDIVDLRAYERERDEYRRRIIELKARRRVSVGPFVSLVFENRETIRFQVQEMARAERMMSDDAISAELDAYNPLIPDPGQLSATLFIELTDEASLREWLPRLVGIERAVVIELGPEDSPGASLARAIPEEAHEEALTRDEVTAAVHYIRFELDRAQVGAFDRGPVRVVVDHPDYRHATELSDGSRHELVTDLRD